MVNIINQETRDKKLLQNRSIRVFVSSTFRDMIEDRNELMTHCWPVLRKFCAERHVELTEVDLRWGISEEQSTRKETLKLCLDEIRACRPFFICLLGERYGWIPGDDAFTADLKQEQPWLKDLHEKSVTELEILHGVLNDPEMAGRAFFFFRDPAYTKDKGDDFLPENKESEEKQIALKNLIRKICREKEIPLHETYASPRALAPLVLAQLKDAIQILFPIEIIPDPLDREAIDHEAFAEIRRRTYIGKPDYYQTLDNHCNGNGSPLLLVGDSGSGKSALFANWVARWRKEHPGDFIFQHYIGSTPDSSNHWKLMIRLIKEIKRWTEDPEELPKTNDEILRDFAVWLVKARHKAEKNNMRFIIILDALNQLDDTDRGRWLGCLPEHPFNGALRLMVSSLPGETLEAVEKRKWQPLRIQSLSTDERGRMIVDYLKRFGQKLDDTRLHRLSGESSAANPLYLKILLDELRVTGTHDKLDERLSDYLEAPDIPSLLQKVLRRYQENYERDRPGLVRDALALVWSARRGLTENELLQLLRPNHLTQLPLVTWAPLRAALEEGLVDRGGILNFAHDFLRTAIETTFTPSLDTKDDYRIKLADYFEALPQANRTLDELPWILMQVELFERLRKCLLKIDNFLLIFDRDKDELRQYWVDLGDIKQAGRPYLDSFTSWADNPELEDIRISMAASNLAFFLSFQLSIHQEAEPLMERALKIDEKIFGPDHPNVARGLNNLAQLLKATNRLKEAQPLIQRVLKTDEKSFGQDHPEVARDLNNLAQLLKATNRLKEAEPLMQRALKIDENSFGPDHPRIATNLCNLAQLLQATNRLKEAEPLMGRALKIDENSFGPDHPDVARDLNNLAMLLQDTNRFKEAEPLMLRALKIDENSFGPDHPNVARDLNNLALMLKTTNRLKEAEPLILRALKIDENSFGPDHPKVAIHLNNLALMLKATNRLKEAEPLMERALKIDENSFGPDHPKIAIRLNNLAALLQDTNRLKEAEPLMQRALKIDENSFGPDHPNIALRLNNMAQFLKATNRLKGAESLARRAVEILVTFSQSTGHQHPHLKTALNNYISLLLATGWSEDQILGQLRKMGF
jgi:tetratricopeptide (TPR) repeat protein